MTRHDTDQAEVTGPRSDASAAVGQTQRLVAADPLDEDAHFEVIRLAGRKAPFVGRDGERRELLLRLVGLMRNEGGIILIEGEAGAGKSRLVDELTRNARWRGATVLAARHTDADRRRPFGGLIDALGETVVGVRGEQLAETVDERWMKSARAVVDPAHSNDTSRPSHRRPTDDRWHRYEALAELLIGQGRVGPTVVVLEDLHCCDDDSVEVLAQLEPRLADSGVLLVLSYRREAANARDALWAALSALGSSEHATRIEVEGLDPDGARFLAKWALGESADDEIALEQVVAETGGNPLYVIETMRAIAEAGHVPSGLVPVGSTVAEAVGRRLDNVERPVVEVLGVLAVANRPMTSAAIGEVASLPHTDVLESLATAVRGGYIVEDGGRCSFDHELVRRAVYGSTGDRERKRLHRTVADAIDRSDEGSVEELAEHFARGGAWSPAGVNYLEAARRAVSLDALQTASEHFVRAHRAHLKAGLGSESLVPLLLEHEAVLDVLADRRRQNEVLDHLAVAAEDERTEVEILRRRALFASNTGRFDEAVTAAMKASELAQSCGQLEAETSTALGVVLFGAGRALEALEPLERGVAEARDDTIRADAYCALGRAQTMVQDFVGARHDLGRALAISEALDDTRRQIDAHGSLGILAIEAGDHLAAEEHLCRAVELAQALGYRRGAAVNLVNLASMFAVSGRSGASLEPYSEALDAFAVIRDRRGTAMVLANRAEIRLRLCDDIDDVAADARRAYRYFSEIEDERHQAMTLETLAAVHLRSGRVAAARRTLRTADMLATRVGDRWLQVQIQRSTALLELGAGRDRIALDAIHSARSTAKELDLVGLMPSLLVIEARVAGALGQRDAGRELAVEAARRLTDSSDLAPLVALWSAQVLHDCGNHDDTVEALAMRAARLLDRELDGLDAEKRTRAVTQSPDRVAIGDLARRSGRRPHTSN